MKGGEFPVSWGGGVQVRAGRRTELSLIPGRRPQRLSQAPFRLPRLPGPRREHCTTRAGRGLLFLSGEPSPRR